jgi:hypothetical protein
MKFETFLLSGLFVACMAICALIMGAMLYATPGSRLASQPSISQQLLAAPSACAMPADGVVCPPQRS